MRNLKRALSLALAAMMLIGMMVVAASAADAKDFTDKDEIQHTEAVNAMVTLNVIAGKEDGSYFDPTGTLTRAEMAKLVTYVLNGGVEPVLGEKVTPTYSDIDGHWAEKYIEYCTSMNIIAGDGSGRFNPEGTLTAEQCAKMLLTAMNYKDDIFGFLGNNWAVNVNREANTAGLYDELGGLAATAPISRDDAAQMVYNAIQAKTMELSWTQDKETGEISQHYQLTGDSLFTDKFNGTVYEGILQASGSVAPYTPDNAQWSAGKEKLHIAAEYIDKDIANPQAANGIAHVTLNCKMDVTDMIGEYVKVLYDNKGKQTYGVYTVADETTVVVETNRGTVGVVDPADVDLDIGNETYDLEGNASQVPVYYTTGAINAAVWARTTLSNGLGLGHDNRNDDYVKMVDNDGNGKIDVVFVVTPTLETVNYVGSSTMTLTTLGSVKNVDMNLADESYAVDQKVFVTPKCSTFNGNYGVAAATVVEGKVDAVRRATVGGSAQPEVTAVQVNGEWYNLVATSNTTDLAVNGSVIVDDKDDALALDSTYKLYVRGGYVYAADIVTSGGTSIAVITGVTNNQDFDGNVQLRILKADGETVTGYMSWASAYPIVDVDGNDLYSEGNVVAYTVSNDVYTLYPLGNQNSTAADNLKAMSGYNVATGIANANANTAPVVNGPAFVAAANGNPATIAGVRVNDDAVVFVQYDSNTGKAGLQSAWKVISGKEVNAWKTNYGTAGAGLYKTSGLGFLDVAFITMANANVMLPGSSSQYAYVTSAISYGSDYATYSIWDGTSESSITVTEKTSASNAAKGAVISYDWDGADVIKNVEVIANRGALTYSNGAQVKISGIAYDLADNVVILNVDTDKKVGISGTAISKAQMTLVDDVYYQNVAYKLNSDGEIAALVVDVVNNEWIGAGTYNDVLGTMVVGAGVTADALKNMQDGVYVPTDTAFAPGDVSGEPEDNVIFKFTTNDATKNYVLSIKSGDAEVYTETLATPANGGHFFWVTTTAADTGNNSGTGTYAAQNFAAGAYTYTITIQGTDTVVASGSFNVQ